MLFRDRRHAGQQLAARLLHLHDDPNVIVLGIPRGGIVVAAEIARALNAPLDIFIAHKISAPFNPELAIGAITSTGEVVLDEELIGALHLSEEDVAEQIEREQNEIARRIAVFRQNRPPLDVQGKTVIVVDDGIATGSTVLAALHALRQQQPAMLILAIPVGPPETVTRLARECDQVAVLEMPAFFSAVGQFYRQFDQTTDAQVIALLNENRNP